MRFQKKRQIALQFVGSTRAHETMRVVGVVLVPDFRVRRGASRPPSHATHERQSLIAQNIETCGDYIRGRYVVERLHEERAELGVHQSVQYIRLQHSVSLR